jgi:hypothetical protein
MFYLGLGTGVLVGLFAAAAFLYFVNDIFPDIKLKDEDGEYRL